MMMWIIGVYLFIGLMTYNSAILHDVFKRQDKILTFLNEAIQSRDLPRKEWPLLEPKKYSFMAFVRGFALTVFLWPMVFNKKLGE